MGLDGVELLLAVEEEFGISVDDADAATLATPGMLSDYVIARLGNVGESKGRCLSQAGFYRIRSALVRQFGARRNEVRPDSPIRNFLNGNIRQQWVELKKAIDAPHLPWLRCRKSIAFPIHIVMPLGGLALLALAGVSSGWALVFVLFALPLCAAIITNRLGDIVPENASTVGALVPYVRFQNHEWTREYVLQGVLLLTAEQLNVSIEKVRPDSHFVKDLGLDS